jgi:hypothetical protein
MGCFAEISKGAVMNQRKRATYRSLPVDKNKHSSRTYGVTGQPYVGLGQWLLYQERKLRRVKK